MFAYFFFIDIVGLSNPILSTMSQASKIKLLNDYIANCKTFEETPKDEKLVFPTGDGFWIAFLTDIEKPIKLSIELHKKLGKLKVENTKKEKIEVRIGCHNGDFFFVNDLNGTVNLWGPGIIISRRLMDMGDSGHILITSTMAENLFELSGEYKKIIHPVHDFKIKHGDVLLVYSVYGDSFGNSKTPQKGIFTNQIGKRFPNGTIPTKYINLKLRLRLIDSQINHLKITRTIKLENLSEEPIYEIYDTIKTNIPRNFNDLDIKCLDENDNNLALSGVHLDTEYKKKYSFKLNKPIFQNEANRQYTISYETTLKNKFYEYFVPADFKNLSVTFAIPTKNLDSNLKLYLIKLKDRQKSLQEKTGVRRGIMTEIKWEKMKVLQKGDLIRLEW